MTNYNHQSGPFPSGFPAKILYAFLIFPVRVTYLIHLILFDLIAVKIFREEDKL